MQHQVTSPECQTGTSTGIPTMSGKFRLYPCTRRGLTSSPCTFGQLWPRIHLFPKSFSAAMKMLWTGAYSRPMKKQRSILHRSECPPEKRVTLRRMTMHLMPIHLMNTISIVFAADPTPPATKTNPNLTVKYLKLHSTLVMKLHVLCIVEIYGSICEKRQKVLISRLPVAELLGLRVSRSGADVLTM